MFQTFFHATIFATLAICLTANSNADVIVSVSDNGNDLLFEWNGNLQLGDLAETGTFSGTFNWLTPSLPRMHGLTGNWDFYDFQSEVLTPFGTGGDFLQNGLKIGDSFGLTIPSGTPGDIHSRLYVPAGYTNRALNGSLTFVGETMASQGIDLTTPVVYDFGSVGTVTFQAIPEPSSIGIVSLTLIGFLAIRRR